VSGVRVPEAPPTKKGSDSMSLPFCVRLLSEIRDSLAWTAARRKPI